MGRELFITIDVEANVTTVYDAIATTEGLASFWTPNVSGEAEEGGTLEFGFEPAPVDLQMHVDELSTGKLVVWSCPGPWPGWEGTEVRWELGDAPGGGTRMVLSHTGWADDYSDADLGNVTYTWALVAGALKRYAESGEADPALR